MHKYISTSTSQYSLQNAHHTHHPETVAAPFVPLFLAPPTSLASRAARAFRGGGGRIWHIAGMRWSDVSGHCPTARRRPAACGVQVDGPICATTPVHRLARITSRARTHATTRIAGRQRRIHSARLRARQQPWPLTTATVGGSSPSAAAGLSAFAARTCTCGVVAPHYCRSRRGCGHRGCCWRHDVFAHLLCARPASPARGTIARLLATPTSAPAHPGRPKAPPHVSGSQMLCCGGSAGACAVIGMPSVLAGRNLSPAVCASPPGDMVTLPIIAETSCTPSDTAGAPPLPLPPRFLARPPRA
jgi:hypothetical protein